jgi:hypothetical protein
MAYVSSQSGPPGRPGMRSAGASAGGGAPAGRGAAGGGVGGGGGERRLALLALAGCCVILAGWIVVLAVTLPHRFDVHHWRGVWVGFDIFLLAVLISVAWAAWRERQVLILLLMVLGTMLCCDAWFDVGTADRGHGGFGWSLLTAIFAELPLAFIAFTGARRLLRATVRTALGNQPAAGAALAPGRPLAAGGQSAAGGRSGPGGQPAAGGQFPQGGEASAGQESHLLRATPLFGGGLEGALPHRRRRPRPGLDQ